MMMLRIIHCQSVVAEILLKLQNSLQQKLLNHQLPNKALGCTNTVLDNAAMLASGTRCI